MVTLQNVTRENWVACTRLSLHEHQVGNLASNVATIAEAKFEVHHQLRSIYKGDKLVGMLAYCQETEPEDTELYWIFRLMIGKEHQGKGFAHDAMKLAVLEIVKQGGKKIRTMHKPGNTTASKLYAKLGFCVIGTLDDGDTLLEYASDLKMP